MFRLALPLVALLSFAIPANAQWTLDDNFKAAKPEDLKDAVGTPAPKDAIVLFDGKSTEAWTKKDGKTAIAWKVADGAMEGVKGHGDIVTKEKFDGKFLLHVEFRVPYEPGNSGQGRGNSGVYLQGRYEIQVLDSYGLKSGKNDCASIYDLFPPKENVTKAPTIWQSYDITFTAPIVKEGKKTEPVHISVVHNGVKVHDDVKVEANNTRAGMGGDISKPGPIMLQDHGHPVQYRNIWLQKLK